MNFFMWEATAITCRIFITPAKDILKQNPGITSRKQRRKLLKDIELLSDNRSDEAEVRATQAEWKTFISALSLVMIKAIMEREDYIVKVIFFHESKRFRVELDRAPEKTIILP